MYYIPQIQNFINAKAPSLAVTYDATISASTAVTLNSATKYVIVSAILKGIFLKWDGTASSSSFDEYIALDETNIYIVPSGTATANFIEEAASAHLVCIEK